MFSRCDVAVARSLAPLLAALCAVLLIHGAADAGTLDLSWTAPTTTVTGLPLTTLAGYRVYYGTASAGCPGPTYLQVASPSPAPAQSQTVTWTLSGLTPGTPYYVAVTAVDSAGQESACVSSASATVARGDLSVTPTSTVSFGSVSVGSSADQTFTVQNDGQAPVSGSVAASAPFSIVSGSPYNVAAGGGRATVTVRFSPTSAVSATSNVTFANNGGDSISRVVTGTGATTQSPTTPTPGGATGADTTAPTVSLTAPANGATVAGSAVILTASATDNVGVVGVQFKVNGNNLGNEVTAPPYRISWYTLSTPNGTHRLSAVARDAAGNTTTSPTVAVTLANGSGAPTSGGGAPTSGPAPDTTPPTVSITSPGATTRTATLTLSGTAADNVGVTQVSWTNNRGGSGTATGTTSWTASVALQTGANVITVTARDAAGNTGQSSVTVTKADTTPPTVSLTAPTNGVAVSGSAVIITAAAADDVGVVGVQFKVDGNNLGSEVTAPPYRISWYTLSTPNGAHKLTAVARDAAGNTTTSAAVTVALANGAAAASTPPTSVSTSTPTPVAPAALTYDNAASSGFQWGVTSVTTPAFTVGSGANRAAMIMVAMTANNATNITASLGGVPATPIPGTDSGTTAVIRTLMFQVINPPSGTQTATVSWTTAMHAEVGVVTVTGADQTTPTTSGRFAAFNASPSAATSVTITSNPGDLTASVGFTTNQWTPGTNQTFTWGPASSPAQGDRGPGAGTTTHTWTDQYAGIPRSVSGANFRAAGRL